MTPEEEREIKERVEKMTREEACNRLEELNRLGAGIASNKPEEPVLASLMYERQLVEKKCGT